MLISALILLLLTVWAGVALKYARPLLDLWREPVLRHPVCIVESDDWGPGDVSHAEVLGRIREVLVRHEDPVGHPACMTIGVLLAIPDCTAMSRMGGQNYVRQTLLDPQHAVIREALQAGEQCGCFSLQLHGLEHLWPESLMAAAKDGKPEVCDWLRAGLGWHTEALPGELQSRWTDASVLPSRELAVSDIEDAVSQEVSFFSEVFGRVPRVVVPPTFIWNATVERAWAAQGVSVVMTPGRRLTGRDADARPAMSDCSNILNAQRGEGGVCYLVRDIYFEPALGHRVAGIIAQIEHRIGLGRPALLETHRFNFVRSELDCAVSLNELDVLFRAVREKWPTTRFMSSERLADMLSENNPVLVEDNRLRRLLVWLRRAHTLPRMHKLLMLSGLIVPCWLLSRLINALAPATTATIDGVST